MTSTNTTEHPAGDGPSFSEQLGLAPERATISLTLADLGVLAATAERNGTQHAFQAVALEWCAKAQAEIERLRAELKTRHEHQHEAEALAGHYLVQRDDARDALAAERERNAGWFALVMNAAAALEDAANCLRDPDAKRAAEGAAKHYRAAANAMWDECEA